MRHLNPAAHPLPDLVIEIDMTHLSLKKFLIYDRINVPEVWRYDGKKVMIFLLREGDYVAAEASRAVPRLDRSELSGLVEMSKPMRHSAWIKFVGEWARSH